MNSPIDITAKLEATRRAVIESLTRSNRKVEAGPEPKPLDESSIRPTFRSVRLMIYI